MDVYKQKDQSFNIYIFFFKFLGVWPTGSGKYYRYYSLFFLVFFVVIFDICFTINFLFLPNELELFVEDLILFSTVITTISKVLTLYITHDKIVKMLSIKERNVFQDDSDDGKKIIAGAKKLNVKCWRIFTVISLVSNLTHISIPMLSYMITGVELQLPVYSCDFLPKNVKNILIYPLYFYQALGIHFLVWYYVTSNGLFLGLMIFIIGQLEILDLKLRKVTTCDKQNDEKEEEAINKLNDCIIHYDEVAKFCRLVQDAFSITLFIQIGTASVILCVCLFRFMLPAPITYYVYLVAYIIVMLAERAVICWYGNQIMEKSACLARSIYDCDWIPRSRRFKNSLRLFVERANRPLSITGGKMVVLSLETFTSIMNLAYSFYTVLRHMQSHEN